MKNPGFHLQSTNPDPDSYQDYSNQLTTTILITGANGQLGMTIQELYAGNRAFNFIFTSKPELDITSKKQLDVFFDKYKFDYCINCAAYTNVEHAEKTPDLAYKVNAEGVKNLAEACKRSNTTLIHISTDYVFDGEKENPYTIDDEPNPLNEYGKSKLLGEHYIQEILNNFFIIRTSWLYSKKYGKNFYRTILELAKTKKELTITTEQLGCPTNTESLATYIMDLIFNKSIDFGLKHMSDNKVMTWFNFAEQILSENKLNNKTKLVKTSNYITFAKRPKNSILLNE
ncbi:MAG: dTDP-4-dehydrorhamnose reductase [Flexibacter sp. CG_4_10_14_3_um_filter_32_15]|nr:MAG: dTDP-4-dehydrorhamnose reductase [Flexibacter sp. CG_4_10_14_3_um_filter_32_15]PJB18785.1 MAG: dTDP-4-dehydrorhamnose reductase [Flavobacteriaceae bacterium CG_4_9_14_3_um_filter_33_16]